MGVAHSDRMMASSTPTLDRFTEYGWAMFKYQPIDALSKLITPADVVAVSYRVANVAFGTALAVRRAVVALCRNTLPMRILQPTGGIKPPAVFVPSEPKRSTPAVEIQQTIERQSLEKFAAVEVTVPAFG